ncbi:MAG: hypothetical protein ACE5H8_00830 [Alphaproteobacteria bacterium]
MQTNAIDSRRRAGAIARVAGGTALATVLLFSVAAFAGDFTEYDANGPLYRAERTYGTPATRDTSNAGDQQAAAENVMTDATTLFLRLDAGDNTSRQWWWQAPGNPQFGGR